MSFARFSRISLLLLAAATACTKSSPDTTAKPEPLADGAADAPAQHVCPQNLPGPKLVKLPALDGSEYCMDQREVTAGEYAAFAKAKGTDMSGQITACDWNERWEPKIVAPDDELLFQSGYCTIAGYDPVTYPDRAVACVDWCDAMGYCAWAGKRLCGGIGGGAATTATMSDPVKSEWTNACTQGGKTKYPWGDTYTAGICIDSTAIQQKGESAKDVTNTSASQCHGALDPFDDVYDLVGSVMEWTAECATLGQFCAIHDTGSMFAPETPEPSCQTGATGARSTNRGVGFRCCANVVTVSP